ncbi:fatty acid cis/trans isomerase [Psychrobium sp. 1_MG-2023]|uniref:fatty acid cis/trans isomerase n=1 Tax=Psychrobium sp. 1_MG-2023 TaxID=3062624 RepID=UPI00268C9521|nr:fatty acid cis/trans isomerase [Psychrobium sp. 1_MG-2023]MDP2562743.1 fatty acid cis/trans isomerase [Psychrobium sp. 1_MG-2023]
MRSLSSSRLQSALLLTLFLSACAIIPQLELDELYGEENPTRFIQPVIATNDSPLSYDANAKGIIDKRCTVCHGCYDAPCQLNLASYDGLARGASKEQVYSGSRLIAAEPSRLFIDAHSPQQWREKGFFPVLNERAPSGDQEASVMHRLLTLKQQHSQQLDNRPLSQQLYDFSLDRSQSCPTTAQLASFEQSTPHWGMPYGLPKLSHNEYTTLSQWLTAGAPVKQLPALSAELQTQVNNWEQFLNQDSLKAQLMARYIYEHWFLANLYFDPSGSAHQRTFFKLVRSKTPPQQPITVIATRTPFETPGVDRVYYRLQRVTATILSKTHMPYALNEQRMKKLTKWFLNDHYQVTSLPSYDLKTASNPFVTFAQIPANSRYRFMLEEARFTIMGFIKGPVCRGQIALNVINDHLWVIFAAPNDDASEQHRLNAIEQHGIIKATKNLRLPADSGSTAGILNWRQYAKHQMAYLEAKSQYVNTIYQEGFKPSLQSVWDGDGHNPNAALTIFRHFDTASVEYGLIGEQPQTMWLIGYPLLEKIHYLLVAGFDVYGNYGHQLKTRLYMDFLRMEGEFNLLGLLPKEARSPLINQWYQGAPETTEKYFTDTRLLLNSESGITYTTQQPYQELQQKIKRHLEPTFMHQFTLDTAKLEQRSIDLLKRINQLSGVKTKLLAQTSILSIETATRKLEHFTLLHHNAHKNVAHIIAEEERRLPQQDSLTLVQGFIGAYPNTFFRVKESQLEQFVIALEQLSSELDYHFLLNQFGIRRTHPNFWQYSDSVHQSFKKWQPLEYGLLDYNRLENR